MKSACVAEMCMLGSVQLGGEPLFPPVWFFTVWMARLKNFGTFVSSALAYFSLEVPAHLWKVLHQPVQLHTDGCAKWGSGYFQRSFREFPTPGTQGNKFWLVCLIHINNLKCCSAKQFGRRRSPKGMPSPEVPSAPMKYWRHLASL